MKDDITMFSAFEISRLVKRREISALEVCGSFIGKIKDDNLNAFITKTFEYALTSAEKVDVMIKENNGDNLALAGVPIAVKDNICTAAARTTCASKALLDFVPSYNASAFERLTRAGAILIGKTNLDEFAIGSENASSYFGGVKNPFDANKVAGGSSGGSAAAVAAGYAPIALGTDTGGSARLPAALCGAVAMKPTYGRVSRFGLISFAPSFEQICPMTRSVLENAATLDLISGPDGRDTTAIEEKASFAEGIDAGVAGLRVGAYSPESCAACVGEAILRAAKILEKNGASVNFIELDSPETAAAVYTTLSSAEASSTLSRYDGIRYGYSGRSVPESRTDSLGSAVKSRITAGAFSLLERDGAYYKSAVSKLREIEKQTAALFEKFDIILMPVSSRAAWKQGENKEGYLIDRFTVLANLTGRPSAAVPVCKTIEGLPVGVGLMGDNLSEAVLYRAAYVLESEREAVLFGGDEK